MATKKQLLNRWVTDPGTRIINQIYSLGIIYPNHHHTPEEIYFLLSDLPYRIEVANGRDFRGAAMAARELSLRDCDFSYGKLGSFYYCDLSGSKFDECTGERCSIHNKASGSSFRKTKLRSCYFSDTELINCDFTDARLTGCNFEKADLTGACFRNANCHQAVFAGSSILGCDFRGANLEEAVFLDVRLDKSTDFSGARLINTYNSDAYDNAGNLRARGTDLRLAHYDSTTIFLVDENRKAAE